MVDTHQSNLSLDRSVSQPLYLALIALMVAAEGTASADDTSSSGDTLQEVVVTAEKRTSTVQKTPISMTAISGDALQAQGTTNMLQLAQETPGVSFRSAGPGQTEFEIRGLASSGGATATVGYYLDDIPISPPALGDIGKVAIDPNLYDLNRVEVLRGPQGTLYGAGSMGGTIKVVSNPAKLNKWEGGADGTISSTTGNGGTNWSASGYLNIPLVTDIASARIAVSSNYTDGWIKRVVVNPFPLPTNTGCTPTTFSGCARGAVQDGPYQQVIPRTNWSRMDSVRANFTLQPTDALKITALAMYERITTGGYSQFDQPPGLVGGTLAHYQPFNDPEPSSDYARLTGVTATYDFEGMQLTSASSYWNRSVNQYQDDAEGFANLYGVPQVFYHTGTYEQDSIRQFSQELRLASTTNEPFQWLVGGFFSHLHSTYIQNAINKQVTDSVYDTGLYAPFTSADNPEGLIYVAQVPYVMKQYAGFLDLSYKFANNIKLDVGGRYYKYDSVVDAVQAGLFTQSVSDATTVVHSATRAGGFNPKFNLSYIPTDELTVYGTVSKGFRPGGINLPLPAAGPNSCTASLAAFGINSNANNYDSDSVWNFEVGEKAKLADNRINLNSAIYYIRWNNIQQFLPLPCGYFFTANAGQARSYGAEAELSAHLGMGMSTQLSGSYTNATINDPSPQIGLPAGTPVLNIPKYTSSASLTYEYPLTSNLSLTARAAVNYTGAITDEAYTYVRLPGYVLVDARLGVVAGNWSVYLTGVNLTDRIAELTANNTAITFNQPSLTRVTVNQPRTIGVNLSAKF